MSLTTNSFIHFTLRAVQTVAFAILFFSANAQTQVTVPTEQTSQPTRVKCDNITFPGEISGDQVIQKGDIPEMMFESAPADGGSGALRYLWMEYLQFGSMPGQWYPILSATSSNYQPGPLSTTRKYMRCVSREGCNNWKSSNTITITVNETAM